MPDAFILEVKGLKKAFGGALVLDGVDAQLRAGEVVLLEGENGSGKTTLLNMLTGNLEPDAGHMIFRTNGATRVFEFPNPWWRGLNPFQRFTSERVASEGTGRTWQEVRLFPTLSLQQNIAVAAPRQTGENPLNVLVRFGEVKAEEAANQGHAESALQTLGLGDRGASSADMISLGQAKRTAIARSVRAGAQILCLDEPLSGLDEAGVQSVMTMLAELAREHRMTLVIVEHTFNAPHILKIASSVWRLEDGRLRAESVPAAADRIHAQAARTSLDVVRSIAGSSQEERIPLPNGASLTLFHSARPNTSGPLLEVRDLVVFRNRRRVIGWPDENGDVKGLSFALREGDLGVLEAPNGWGKSSLLAALDGTLPPHTGEVRIAGRPATAWTSWRRATEGVGVLRSDHTLFPRLSVRETLQLAGANHPDARLKTLGWRRVGALSGGEHKRLAFRCADTVGSRVLLLDEPFSALDRAAIGELLPPGLLSGRAVLITLPCSTMLKS